MHCHFCSDVAYFSVFIRGSLCTVLLHVSKGVNDSEVKYSCIHPSKKVLKEIEVNSCKSRGLNILLPSLQHLNDIDLSFILGSNSSFHKISKALPYHNNVRKLLELIL